jgi:6,7-dimethyl-8-ribityllumazine synthase
MAVKIFEAQMNAENIKVAIVVARFNEIVTRPLKDGAIHALLRHGANENDIAEFWVPGAFELPLIADKLASSKKWDAVICIGAVIRGDTPHFDQVVGATTSGIAQTSLKHGTPIIFGVLTTDTVEQALDRSGLKSGNKGAEAALTAIEMANLLKAIT